MRILIALLAFLLLLGSQAHAATYTADSCSVADVTTALGLASNGDTVIIPNGSCSWATGITTSKQVKFQGQTKGSVTLTLTDNVVMFDLTTGSSYSTEVSNLKFTHNFVAAQSSSRYIKISGDTTDDAFLIHDNDFRSDYNNSYPIDILRMGPGLIYNNTFWGNGNGGCASEAGYPCGGQLGIRQKTGDTPAGNSWSTDHTMGTADTTGLNNIYVEYNTFTNIEVTMDWDDGARAVVRYNTFNDSPVGSHGADTSGYGMRHVEVYNNLFVHNNSGTWTLGAVTGYYPLNMSGGWWGQRGGTAVVTKNTIPEMGNGTWGTGKGEIKLQVEQIDRNAGPDNCCNQSSYLHPCLHQVGRGKDNASEPVYIWNNTYVDSGFGDAALTIAIDNSGYNECSGVNPENYDNPGFYIQVDRNYYLSAKSGWVAYTCPHPLTGYGGTCGTGAGTTYYNISGSQFSIGAGISATGISW